MKKIYINPAMEIIKIQTQQMLAASDPQLSGEFNPGSDPVLGRENAWFEEE